MSTMDRNRCPLSAESAQAVGTEERHHAPHLGDGASDGTRLAPEARRSGGPGGRPDDNAPGHGAGVIGQRGGDFGPVGERIQTSGHVSHNIARGLDSSDRASTKRQRQNFAGSAMLPQCTSKKKAAQLALYRLLGKRKDWQRATFPHSCMQYHRRGGPSPSCSRWERVLRPRHGHQSKRIGQVHRHCGSGVGGAWETNRMPC